VRKVTICMFSTIFVASTALAQKDAEFMSSVLSARVVELNFVWDRNSPLMPLNPPFSIVLHTSHKETEGMIPGMSFAADLMVFSGQHGAPNIDAIGHIASHGKLYGGIDAVSSETTAGMTVHGIENYPKEKFVNRGVLLDVARQKGVDALEPGYVITASDLEETAKAENVVLRAGDSVLINTGFGQYFESDPAKYLGPHPGIGEESARWLAAKKIFLTGADQLTFDAGPPFPGHRILIAENGVHLVENLNLIELSSLLAERGSYEFVLVVNPVRLRGATGAPLNAFALLP
jgi:kynurenine formamidase